MCVVFKLSCGDGIRMVQDVHTDLKNHFWEVDIARMSILVNKQFYIGTGKVFLRKMTLGEKEVLKVVWW